MSVTRPFIRQKALFTARVERAFASYPGDALGYGLARDDHCRERGIRHRRPVPARLREGPEPSDLAPRRRAERISPTEGERLRLLRAGERARRYDRDPR